MDFGIKNPAMGHSSHIDEKSLAWGGVDADILAYLSDVSKLEQFADMAQNADQLAQYLDPFLENASKYFEAMQKLADGQVSGYAKIFIHFMKKYYQENKMPLKG